MIAWATCGITMLTYYVSAEGIREYREPELLAMLEKAKLVKALDPSRPKMQVMKYEDGSEREFFSVNLCAGDENGTCTEGGTMYSLAALNRYNRDREKEEAGK